MGEIIKTKTEIIETNFSEIYNPKIAFKSNINNIQQAIKSELPTINKLRKLDEQKTVTLIALYIDEINNEIHIKERMSEKNIGITAIRIIQKYGYMKLSDIIYVLNKFLDGEIKLYGSLNRTDILGAFHDHEKLRSMR